MSLESVTFNNQLTMPSIGLGVYKARDNEATQAVQTALDAGYRLIDTASIYGNEAEVGQGLKNSNIAREDIFVTTKLWMSDYQNPIDALDSSLKKLQSDYVDLYLLHWPVPHQFNQTIKAYKSFEKAVQEGKVKSLGVSNFTEAHLDELMKHISIKPVLNQIEVHPYFAQKKMLKVNQDHGIITQAWSPIGGVLHRNDKSDIHILKDEYIHSIAEKHGRTPVQVILRWHLQNGISAIPKSVTPERIRTNIEVFDFELKAEDMATLNSLNQDFRAGPHPNTFQG